MELVFLWLGVAVVTGLAATGKGRGFWPWFLIGVFTGIFGLIAVLVMRAVDPPVVVHSATDRSAASRVVDDWPPRRSPTPPPPPMSLQVMGDGKFAFDIVGERSYQDSLEYFAGGRKYDSANVTVLVTIVPDDGNLHDPNAIKVICQGVTVGFLSRRDAVAWRAALTNQEERVQPVTARAVIVGGWKRDDVDDDDDFPSEGEFGMRLDVGKPFRFRRGYGLETRPPQDT